ncbi:hypothetical protein D1J36_001385 [Riemerella anatipestifer]|uniref:hypothetical protein n=1 Tax=Riemerella anatipestifer TaxID=34085 RepID=UPI0012AD5542|nr:hypothetical protein [Riemerella anatipestifer]USL95790.1 hypothetical protein D1J36_001385 [Riemerella anatipestifer]
MKNLFLGLCFAVMGLFSNQVQAAKVIPIGTTEKLEMVADLPNTEDYQDRPGEYVDLGIKYRYFHIAWMPVWITEEPTLVGLSSINKEIYYELTDQQIKDIIKENKLASAEELAKLSFLDRHWGKLVILGIIVLYLGYSMFFGSNEEEEEEKKEEN